MASGGVLLLVFSLVGLGVYFFPVVCAWSRDHSNTTAIFVLNLFLGWTVIGWVGAMVWAFTNPARTSAAPEEATRKCPYCAEDVRAEAVKCKHCGSDITAQSA